METYIYNINKDDIIINKTELALRLNTPKDYTNDLLTECINKVKAGINPRCCYTRVPFVSEGKDRICFEFASFTSENLHYTLSGCKEAYIMAVTLGVETDRLIAGLSAISKTRGFLADAVASAMAEAAIDVLNNYLKSNANLCPRFSPGYGDLDISVQREILQILNADKILGIKLGENLIMTPRKSITAICGIKE